MTSAYPTLEQMAKLLSGKIEYDEFLPGSCPRPGGAKKGCSQARVAPLLSSPLIQPPPSQGGGTLRPSGIGSDR